MIEYWGSDQCEACVETLNFLQQTPFEFVYVDAATLKFEGVIPRLVLDDSTHIIGPAAIRQYVTNWLNQKGMNFSSQPYKKEIRTRWSRW